MGPPRRRPPRGDLSRRRPGSPAHTVRLPDREAPTEGHRRPDLDAGRHAVREALQRLRLADRGGEPLASVTRRRCLGRRGAAGRARLRRPGRDRRDRVSPLRRASPKLLPDPRGTRRDARRRPLAGDPGGARRAAAPRGTARKEGARRPDPPAAHVPAVSCTVICQNEERLLAHCLESVTWCDEIVVVDGGSTDGTLGIARRFASRILVNPWPGYRAQKQAALDASRGEWVLNVDADERVTPDLATELRAALAEVPAGGVGFAIPRLVCYLGRWWYRGGWYPRPIVRLVRRTATRWGGVDPHERAEVKGRVVRLRWPLLHYTYRDITDHLRSLNKLTSVAAGQPKLPQRIGASRLVAEPAWRFVRSYLVHRGFVDGVPGLFVAMTGAFYVFLRWAKVWERRRDEEQAGEVPPLDRSQAGF